MSSTNYWKDRTARAQAKLTNKNIKQINKQLKKYYGKAMERVINDFESTYDKLLATQEAGREPTPADLYKLDKYWTMQAQIKRELQKLGDRQISAMSKIFEIQFFDIYYSIALPSQKAFSKINTEGAMQLINAIWCADGKSFSQRVWDNVNSLVDTLNNGLLDSVITGRKTSQLKKILQERFSVSYNRADAVVRTEMSHIQNTAAKQRYEDYGITKFQVWADKDERRCDVCGKLHKKIYDTRAAVPVPVHPRCRCSIIPVVEEEKATKKTIVKELAKTSKEKPINQIEFNLTGKNELYDNNIRTSIAELVDEYNTPLKKVSHASVGSIKAAGITTDYGRTMKIARADKETIYHEFGHTFASKQGAELLGENKDFWEEFKKVRKNYYKEVKAIEKRAMTDKDFNMLEAKQKIAITPGNTYYHDSEDEFLAEAFSYAKLGKTESPYAKEVLELIDKYFKKRKK
jgi:SPP1 gp7 family putative phage head morphogenesis protein